MMSWEKLCNHQIRCCMKWFSVIVKSFQMLKTAIFISDYSIVCSTVEHTCSLWGTSHFLRKDPSWKLLMRQAVQEASVPITCAPITFTKMEMFECSKMDTAAGGLVAKQLQAIAWQLWVAVLWSPDRCLRQACLDVFQTAVLSLQQHISRQPGCDISIYQQQKWVNAEFRSQKILLL